MFSLWPMQRRTNLNEQLKGREGNTKTAANDGHSLQEVESNSTA